MNNITMTGRLTAQPELKSTQSGVSVCSFTLAVKRPRTKDETDFIPCNAWRQSAEFLCNYGTKGSMVGVTGSLTSRKWQDKDGNNRVSYEVVCDTVELLESKGGAQAGNNTAATANAPQNSAQPAFAPASQYVPEQYQSSAPQMQELGDDEDLPF